MSGLAANVCLRIALGVLGGYRVALGPLMGGACRFVPSCSCYAEDAFLTWGVLRGASLTLRRLLRCHPWGGSGLDPVPAREQVPHAGSKVRVRQIGTP